jgi:hypothetical protein
MSQINVTARHAARLRPAIAARTAPHALLAAAAAMLIFARFLPGNPVYPGSLVDDSWRWAMNIATARHLAFGRDIIFTYGPYAPIVSRAYDPALRGLIILGAAIPAAAFAAGLIALAEPLILVLAMLALPLVQPTDALAIALPWPAILLCAGALRRGDRPPGLTPAVLLLAVALGLLPLIKLSLLPVSVIGGGLTALLLWQSRRRKLAAALPALSAAAILALWAIAGQPLSALPDYIRTGLQIIAGYGEAMARFGPTAHLMRVIYASLALLALTAWQWRKLPRSSRAALLLGLALLLWIAIKAGFVRDDTGHENVTLSAIAAIFLVTAQQAKLPPVRKLPASPRPRTKVFCFFFSKKQTLYLLSLSAASLLLTWPFEQPFTPSLLLGALIDSRADLTGALRLLTDPQTLARNDNAAKAAIPPLPWHPRGTADIYETGQAFLFASDLPWSPRPVIQSYTAYTPGLLRLNADHLRGATAPDNVFFRPEPIDMRLPALDDGASWPALLSRYTPAGYDQDTDLAWLRRDPAPPPLPAPGPPLVTATPLLGQTVTLPGAPALWARIDVRPSIAGHVAGLALRMPPLWITLNVPPLPPYRFRFIPAMARDGFLLSPLVLTATDFLRLRPVPGETSPPARRPASFTLAAADGQRWAYRNHYRLSLAPIALPPAPPPAVAPLAAPRLLQAVAPDRPWICFLDTVDDQPIRATVAAPPWPVRIQGWTVFDLQKGLPVDRAELGFQADDGRLWAVPAQLLPSGFVADYLHQPAFGHAGLRAELDLSSLPPGHYAARVLAHRGGETVSCPTTLRVRK